MFYVRIILGGTMNKGFTLVELIAVVTILAILAVITMPAYQTISTNIKTRNYESKKSTISSETLAYVEKYMKDKIYDGSKDIEKERNKNYCFTVNFLIQNGIIISDDEEKEYIKNEITDETYSGGQVYIMVYYDLSSLKLKSEIIKNSDSFNSDSIEKKCEITLD